MTPEYLSKLDDLTVWIASYIDKAAFLSEAAESERTTISSYDKEYKDAAGYALKITVTYDEIINDYLRLLQEKARELAELRNQLYQDLQKNLQNQ